MTNTYHFLSGLPRTGSSLLSAVLSQNPDIHAGGNSALCQLMWDTQQSCRQTAYQQLAATKKFEQIQKTLCSNLPDTYYSDVKGKHVFDKCRSWTLSDNMNMICDYITKDPKVIVMVRPIEDIVASFVKLNQENGVDEINYDAMLADWAEPIMRSYNGVMFAKNVNSGEFLFVDYDNLTKNKQSELDRIYKFVGMDSYKHDFNNIKVSYPEDDNVYGLKGMHAVRKSVKKRKVTLELPKYVLAKCKELTKNLYDGLQLTSTE